MRVAIVHDWLYTIGGAERVLAAILKCFPDADLFTLFDFLRDEDRAKIGLKSTKTSFLQKMPFIKSRHRSYLPLMPFAIEQFDLSGYDLVISSSHAVARGVITGPDQLHICYVHSPMRYAWDMQHFYLRQSRADKGLRGFAARSILHYMRMWDVRTAHGPDAMIANSDFVARRIRKTYGRPATVIHPPVAMSTSSAIKPRKSYFLTASRLVPYKNIDVIVEAFTRMPDLQLLVAGVGPEMARLKAMAGNNVTFLGWVSDSQLRELMAFARAFVFSAEEDFGIIPVEAQSEGTPVLALGRGGALETIKGEAPDQTGVFFPEASPEAIVRCVRDFVRIEPSITRLNCKVQAEKFSAEAFSKKLMAFIDQQILHFRHTERSSLPNANGSRHRTMP